MFRLREHPAIGSLTTSRRKFSMASRQFQAARNPRRSFELFASIGMEPVGVFTIFLGETGAGLFDVDVMERMRNRGIGRALVRYACEFARECGAKAAVLIATNMGLSVYTKVGFR